MEEYSEHGYLRPVVYGTLAALGSGVAYYAIRAENEIRLTKPDVFSSLAYEAIGLHFLSAASVMLTIGLAYKTYKSLKRK